jgi:hypothetical protein
VVAGVEEGRADGFGRYHFEEEEDGFTFECLVQSLDILDLDSSISLPSISFSNKKIRILLPYCHILLII